MDSDRRMTTDQITSFGRYIIENLIGAGGSGRVYRAFDPDRNRIVALKVLNATEADEDTISKIRFRREFQAASQLNHPHLVQVFDIGNHDDREYFTMECIDGSDLDHYLSNYDTRHDSNPDLNAPERIAHILDLLIQMADSLSYLHSFMYVHRDLKPANVLVTSDGCVKLTDFGLMRQQGSSQMTRTGAILGTVEYMSPEQTVTARVDARSDLYSFGVIAFKLFTGVLPFTGGLMRQLMARTREEAPDPRVYNPKLDTQICHLIMRLLKRRPEERYQTAKALWDGLLQIRESLCGHNALDSATQAAEPISIIVNEPACVGRDAAIADLRRYLDILRHGNKGSVYMIKGEAGIGKTRLIEELRTLATFHGIVCFKGVCSPTNPNSLAPWCDIVQAFHPIISAYSSEECSRLLTTLQTLVEGFHNAPSQNHTVPESAKYQFFDVASRFLVLASRATPMILHLEDAHHATPDTIEFLQFIARRAIFPGESGASIDQQGRIIIFVSYQLVPLPAVVSLGKMDRLFGKHDGFRTLHLGRLTLQDTELVAHGMLSGEIAIPDFVARIDRVAHGNPLCIVSFIRNLVASREIKRRGVVWIEPVPENAEESFDFDSQPLPESVQSSVTCFLNAQSDIERHLLQSASILGDSFFFEHLVAVASVSEDDALDGIDQLLSNGTLTEDPNNDERFEFVSPFLLRLIYESISSDLRSEYHRQALTIGSSATVSHRMSSAELARHAMLSNDPNVGIHGMATANKLMLAGCIPSAALFFHNICATVSDESFVYLEAKSMYARCLSIMNRFKAANGQYSSLLEIISRANSSLTADEILQAECSARIGIAEIEAALGNIDQAIAQIDPLMQHISTTTPQNRIEILHASGTFSMYKGDLDAATVAFQSAFELAETLRDAHHSARAHHLNGLLYFYRSDYHRSKESFDTALVLRTELNEILGIAQIKSNLGIIEKIHDHPDAAAIMFRDAASIAEHACDVSNWALYLQNLASTLLMQGAIDQSVSNYRRALAIFEEFRILPRIAMCLNNLGGALWDSQKLSEALTMFMRALSIYEQLGHQLAQAACLGNICVTLLELDQLDLAQDYLDRARRIYAHIGTSPGITEAEIHRARLCIRSGRFADAESVLATIDTSINIGKLTIALYHFAIGELGIATSRDNLLGHSTVDHLSQSISMFKEIRKHGFAQIASMKLGRHLVVSGIDPDRGEMILDELRQQT